MVAQYIGSSRLDQWWHWTAEHDIVALNIERVDWNFRKTLKTHLLRNAFGHLVH